MPAKKKTSKRRTGVVPAPGEENPNKMPRMLIDGREPFMHIGDLVEQLEAMHLRDGLSAYQAAQALKAVRSKIMEDN